MEKQEIRVVDGHDLMTSPTEPMDWIVQGLIPSGATLDVFGPPGAGKSSLLTDFAVAFAGETGLWHGRAIQGGPVALLGGERTSAGALQRDLKRTGRPAPARGGLTIPVDAQGDFPPMWRWDRRADGGSGEWLLTEWGVRVTDWVTGARIRVAILDTILSVAQGSDLLNQPQQYSLGKTIMGWTRLTGLDASITVSHTNQASAKESISSRLDYLSRAGGNGLPGAIRHIAGLTKLNPEIDGKLAAALGTYPQQDESLFAFGWSKYNEMPRPDWTNHSPSIFTQRSGQVELLFTGDEVRDAMGLYQRAAEAAGQDKKQRRRDKAKASHDDFAVIGGVGDEDL